MPWRVGLNFLYLVLGVTCTLIVGFIPAIFVVFNSVFSDYRLTFVNVFILLMMVLVSYLVLGILFGFFISLRLMKRMWVWGLLLASPAMLVLLLYFFSEQQLFLMIGAEFILAPVAAVSGTTLGAYLRSKR